MMKIKMYNELKQFKTLTVDELNQLFIKYHNGDESAKDIIIKHNIKLIIYFAKSIKINNQLIEFDDLISEGVLGLNKAIEKFDHTRTTTFSSYACFWILKYIKEYIQTIDNTIKIPQLKKRINFEIQKTIEQMKQLNNYEVFQEDIQSQNKFTPAELNYYFNNDGKKYDRIDNENDLIDYSYTTQDDEDVNAIKYNNIINKLNLLSEREQYIIINYYGLNNTTPIKLNEIGKQLNLSKMRISQLKKEALIKLNL